MSKPRRGVRWGWVFLGALLAEVALIPGAFVSGWIQTKLGWGIVGGYFLYSLLFFSILLPFGYWVAQKSDSSAILNGTLVGTVAALLFLPILIWSPQSWGPDGPNYAMETVVSLSKVVGGSFGGFMAHRRKVFRGHAA